MKAHKYTWDGLAAAFNKPFGATVVVYRRQPIGIELLHRVHHGKDYAGDWASTPPSGCRFPDGTIDACASRELMEEAGLDLSLHKVVQENDGWGVYVAELPYLARMQLLDKEHNAYTWASARSALRLCRPKELAEEVSAAVKFITAH